MPLTRILLTGLLLAGAAAPAWAQLGSSSNPPPQTLFHFNDTPKRLNNGLGTMAERRAELARINRQRARHQPAPAHK